MGGIFDLLGLGIDSSRLPFSSTPVGRGGSSHSDVDSAVKSYMGYGRTTDKLTGYTGTPEEIRQQARNNGMSAAELAKLDQRLADQGKFFHYS